MDLVIREARLRGRDGLHDIGVRGGRIAAIEKTVAEKGEQEVDAAGRLVTASFDEPAHPCGQGVSRRKNGPVASALVG